MNLRLFLLYYTKVAVMKIGVNIFGTGKESFKEISEIGFDFVEILLVFNKDFQEFNNNPYMPKALMSEDQIIEIIPQLKKLNLEIGSCQIGFKDGYSLVGKKVFLFGIDSRNNLTVFTKGDSFPDHPFGKDTFIIIFK